MKKYNIGDRHDHGTILNIFSQDDSNIPTSYIVNYNDEYKKYTTTIGGYTHWFGADWIPEDCLKGFCEVMTRSLMEAYNHGCKVENNKLSDSYKKLISSINNPLSWSNQND